MGRKTGCSGFMCVNGLAVLGVSQVTTQTQLKGSFSVCKIIPDTDPGGD